LVEFATATGPVPGLSASEMLATAQLRSTLPVDMLNRLRWMTAYGGQGTFLTSADVGRLYMFRARVEGFAAKVATTDSGKALATKLLESANQNVTAAMAELNSTAAAEAAKNLAKKSAGNKSKTPSKEAEAQTNGSLLRILTLSELVPPDLDRRLRWAENYQTETRLDYQETIRFMFFAAAVAVASESTDLSPQEKQILENMSAFNGSVSRYTLLDEAAVKMLKGTAQLNSEMSDPSFAAIRHILDKISRGSGAEKLFAPVCARIF
jgi:hypothetical protein